MTATGKGVCRFRCDASAAVLMRQPLALRGWPSRSSPDKTTCPRSGPNRKTACSGVVLAQLEVSAIGLGCLTLTAAYGTPPPEADAIGIIHRARRTRHRLARYVRRLCQGRQRGAGGQGDRRPARRLRGGEQVRQSAQAGRHACRGRPAGLCEAGLRGEPAAAEHRHDRSVLHPPRRSDGADRGHGGRDGRTGARRQGALPRAFPRRRRQRSAAPMRCIR